MHDNIKIDLIIVSRLNLVDNQIYTPVSMSSFFPSFEGGKKVKQPNKNSPTCPPKINLTKMR